MAISIDTIIQVKIEALKKLDNWEHSDFTDFEQKDIARNFINEFEDYVRDEDDLTSFLERLEDGDIVDEWSERQVSVYTQEIFEWYAQSSMRISYLQESVDSFNGDSAYNLIRMGAVYYAREAANIGISCLKLAIEDLK